MPFEIRETWVGFVEHSGCWQTELRVDSLVVLGDDYAHDGVLVHYGRHAIDADAASIAVVKGVWARDAQRVFHAGVPVTGADPASFRALSAVYGRDGRSVFCRSRPVEAADVDSFSVVGGNYGRDARHVFDCGNVLAGADPATFRVHDDEWAADAGRVFRFGIAQPGLDPAGFAVHGPYLCHGGTVWFDGRPVHADPATFVGLGGEFGADATGVFYRDNRIAAADRASFAVLDGPFARDATTVYLGDRPWPDEIPDDVEEPVAVLRARALARRGDVAAMRDLAEHFGTGENRFSRRYRTGAEEQLWLLAAAAFGDVEAAELAADPHGLSERAQRTVRARLVDMLTTGHGLPQDPARAAALASATKPKRLRQ